MREDGRARGLREVGGIEGGLWGGWDRRGTGVGRDGVGRGGARRGEVRAVPVSTEARRARELT